MRHDTFTDALLSDCGDALDETTREIMEAGFGADFAGVVIHTSPLAAFANRALASKAFTVENHIFFAESAYRPETRFGRLLIAHELAHVVQKRLRGTAPAASNERAAELEADVAAVRVAQGGRYRCVVPLPAHTASCWGEAGHYYTSYFVLLAAGVGNDQAKNIALFAQMGDEVIELDAKEQYFEWMRNQAKGAALESAAIYSNPFSIANYKNPYEDALRVCREIGMGLHCLTGASSERETGWRASVIENAPGSAGDLMLGLAIHAFGDSFAHRDMTDPTKMYPPLIGHGRIMLDDAKQFKMPSKALAEIPDHIDKRPDLYLQYGQELYAIARYRWPKPTTDVISFGALSEALTQIAQVTGDAQMRKIRTLSDQMGKSIDPNYFPEKLIFDGESYEECVSHDRFMALHKKVPPNFLNQARTLAHGWSYLCAKPAPARKSKVSDYKDVQPTPAQSVARTHTVAPGDSLWAIAKRYYGSTEKWPSIWHEPQNQKLIGKNPNFIKVGWTLVIP